MAERIQRDRDGNAYIFRGGEWQQATPDEVELLNRNPLSVGAESAVGLLKAAAKGGGSLISAMPAGAQYMRDSAMQDLQRVDQIAQLRPGAASIGDALLELPLLAIPGASAARRGGRLVPDVKAPTPNSDNVTDLGAVVRAVGADAHGADSAGAAARGSYWQALKRMPKFNAMLEGLEDMVGARRPMTADQRRFIDNGDVERVGLQLLPGQRNGNDVISEVIKRDPLLADAFDSITSANSEQLLAKVSRSVGLEPGDWGRDIRNLSRASVGQMFKDVVPHIGEVRVGDELAGVINQALTKAERETLELGTEAIRGQDVMDIRRLMAEELAARQSSPRMVRDAREMGQALDEFDRLIEQSVTDPQALTKWKEARDRWRVVRALDAQGVVTQDGGISVKTLANALEREFVTEFRRQSLAGGDLPVDVGEMLDYVRVARTFMSNLNDSGTATGNALLQAVTNPVTFARKRLVARFLSDVLVNDPERAATLAAGEATEEILGAARTAQ